MKRCILFERQLYLLLCYFFSPTPDVYWEKLNDQLPDRAKLKSFGQELQISDLELSDAGTYECMGTNTETTQRATKAFTVRIECKYQSVIGGCSKSVYVPKCDLRMYE